MIWPFSEAREACFGPERLVLAPRGLFCPERLILAPSQARMNVSVWDLGLRMTSRWVDYSKVNVAR